MKQYDIIEEPIAGTDNVLISVSSGSEILHSFSVRRTIACKAILKIKKYSYLVGSVKHISLFETERLEDHLEEFVCNEEKAEDSSVLLIVLESLVKKEIANCSSFLYKILSSLEEASDEEILSIVFKVLPASYVSSYAETRESFSKKNRGTMCDIINQVRSVFDIAKIKALDIDDILQESLMAVFSEDMAGEQPLLDISYHATSLKDFMSNVEVSKMSTFGKSTSIFKKDGFNVSFSWDGETPHLSVSYLGACFLLNGYRHPNLGETSEIFSLSGDEFWECFIEEVGRRKEMLLREESLKELELQKQKLAMLESLFISSEKETRSFSTVAELYRRSTGEKKSSQTMNNILGSALGKMRDVFQEKELHFADFIES